MPEIIKTLLDPRKIERYLVGVADVEAEWSVHELNAYGEVWADSGPNAIALDAAYSDHVLIKYELWDGEPAASDWDESWSGSVHLTSGKIFALSCHSGEATDHEEFNLGRRDHEWQFRIHRKLLSHEDFTTKIIGFALFKLQFWSRTAAVRPYSEDEPPHGL
ncbi:hypothetical protein OG589_35235 [Sphaerisporangium sp. NBC_01403]|uniref:hypothetical protein n=1 Tax=Sphaerisporangium sp. NBC_01403 TaxID=2903599 RepID=UPI00324DDA7B